MALKEAAAAPFSRVNCKSFKQATNSDSPVPQWWLQVASPCPGQQVHTAKRRAQHLPELYRFFYPSPQAKAFAERSPQTCLTSKFLLLPPAACFWHGSRFCFVLFSSLHNFCNFLSASCASLLPLPCQRFFPTASLPPSSNLSVPGKWHLQRLGCFMPSPSALPYFCWVLPSASKSSQTTASLHLHFLQRVILPSGGNVRLKRTQKKVDYWASLLYQQMGRSFLA